MNVRKVGWCVFIRSRLRLIEGTMVTFDRDISSFTQLLNIADYKSDM